VFRRDYWLCRWCGRPVIFAPVMRQFEQFARRSGFDGPLAYFHDRWRRDGSPLLDHLAAVVDHVHAYARGGAHEESNFATACNKCNMRKTDGKAKEPRRLVKAKYGEPQHWDGFATLFALLAEQDPARLTRSDTEWLRALKAEQLNFITNQLDHAVALGTALLCGHGSGSSTSSEPWIGVFRPYSRSPLDSSSQIA
jgi:5-methylcytosine-specific restriction endonuclease McrA